MKKFLFFFLIFNFKTYAFDPYSGISCKSLDSNYSVEFFFKNDGVSFYDKVYKRIDGEFVIVGSVVGKKLSSFILFEDKSVSNKIDFAWHLDEVTKNLYPYLLSNFNDKINNEESLSCISKNFWY